MRKVEIKGNRKEKRERGGDRQVERKNEKEMNTWKSDHSIFPYRILQCLPSVL